MTPRPTITRRAALVMLSATTAAALLPLTNAASAPTRDLAARISADAQQLRTTAPTKAALPAALEQRQAAEQVRTWAARHGLTVDLLTTTNPRTSHITTPAGPAKTTELEVTLRAHAPHQDLTAALSALAKTHPFISVREVQVSPVTAKVSALRATLTLHAARSPR